MNIQDFLLLSAMMFFAGSLSKNSPTAAWLFGTALLIVGIFAGIIK